MGHVFYSGICQTDEFVETLIRPLIQPMSESYLEVFDLATNSETSKEKREFFGLRDFYRYNCWRFFSNFEHIYNAHNNIMDLIHNRQCLHCCTHFGFSLVKMVYGFVERSKKKPTWWEMLHAIRRNFGGLDEINPELCFRKHLTNIIHINAPVCLLLKQKISK